MVCNKYPNYWLSLASVSKFKIKLMLQIEKKINQKMMNSKKTEFIMYLVFRILFLV